MTWKLRFSLKWMLEWSTITVCLLFAFPVSLLFCSAIFCAHCLLCGSAWSHFVLWELDSRQLWLQNYFKTSRVLSKSERINQFWRSVCNALTLSHDAFAVLLRSGAGSRWHGGSRYMCWIRWVQRNTCYATHVESGVESCVITYVRSSLAFTCCWHRLERDTICQLFVHTCAAV